MIEKPKLVKKNVFISLKKKCIVICVTVATLHDQSGNLGSLQD